MRVCVQKNEKFCEFSKLCCTVTGAADYPSNFIFSCTSFNKIIMAVLDSILNPLESKRFQRHGINIFRMLNCPGNVIGKDIQVSCFFGLFFLHTVWKPADAV